MYAFLVLCAVHYGGIAWNNLSFVNAGLLEGKDVPIAIGRSVRSVAWMIFLAWYFLLSQRTDEFFERS